MKTIFRKPIALLMALFVSMAFLSSSVLAQEEDLMEDGSVWQLTFVKLKANMGGKYLQGLKKTWGEAHQQFVDAGLIKSYKILGGQAANEDDFDLLLMVEYENYATFDSNEARDKKYQEIEKKLRDAMGEEWQKTVEGYASLREIQGTKVMRELSFK